MWIKKYKENSHRTIAEIQDMQKKHAKDLIQPRDGDGELNPAFIKVHGTKNLNITEHDIKVMAKKSISMANFISNGKNENRRLNN